MLQVISAIIFYAMFGLLLALLWKLAHNLKIYAQAWLTLINVHKQDSDSMQKIAEAVYSLARALEKPQ